ncbi:MAG TPA: c-type cytochrome [Anaerolineales bacterium]|nr:c-type cytochrome [Anaerolineales bacterium]
MKFRFVIIVTLSTLLSACNFTLAEDVTPPPGYVPPTPMPTLALHPAQTPSTANGALIYAEKCAPCHGGTGMGDGKQGIQLGVTVPAFGLPEVARPASPSQWYEIVTRGNMERFMPPFASLNDQERWDVVAYAMSLHTSEEQIAKGQQLFETNCANCSTDFFKDQTKMSALSEVELARIARQGNDQIKPFGANLSDEDLWTVTAYLRSLSFDAAPIAAASTSTATLEAVAATIAPAETGTPSAEGTIAATEQATAAPEATAVVKAGFGTVSGSIENKTGKDLPSGLKVTLHGFDHGSDPSTGAQEVFSQEGGVQPDGTFAFENIEIPPRRIFLAVVTVDDRDLQSGLAVVQEGDTNVTLPPIPLYNKTEDTSKLVVDNVRIFFQYGADAIQVINVYSFRNRSEEAIVVKLNENGEIPSFAKPPEGSSGFGYDFTQDGEKPIQTQTGFEIPPSEGSYGLITFVSLPRTKKVEFAQQFVLPAPEVTAFVPVGVKVAGAQAQDLGTQAMQDLTFQTYELNGVEAGKNLQFTVSGGPREAGNGNQNILLGIGALGLILILAGAWMYLRDRNSAKSGEAEEEEDEFKSAEDVMDAIIALDDLHRDRKISDAAYQKRRAELKEILKGKM